jgi:hypothetical protein
MSRERCSKRRVRRGAECQVLSRKHTCPCSSLETTHAGAWVSPSGGRHLRSPKSSHLHGGTDKATLASREERSPRKRRAGQPEATGVSEVRSDRGRAEENAARQPEQGPPKRIRRRETPDPPVSWSWVQARGPRARREPRRDAGSSRGAGARSQDVGSRSRSYASCSFSAASRKADCRQDELARGELPFATDVAGSGL